MRSGHSFRRHLPHCMKPLLPRRVLVAIDGEIFQDAYLATLGPDTEMFLIPKNRRRLSPDHSSGSPALRRPTKKVASHRRRTFCGPQIPLARRSAMLDNGSGWVGT